MIPLTPNLDDIDFDALVEIGRGLLPSLTRARDGSQIWDDYNYHDPGITLIELLAFIADTQIYSIGRNRQDERRAMAALLGVTPNGAMPARGALYPLDKPPNSYRIDKSTRVTPTLALAPRLETAAAIDVAPVKLVKLTREIAGEVVDLTATNEQARASFAPFGETSAPGAALRLTLQGALPAHDTRLSLGFEMEAETGFVQSDAIRAFYQSDEQPLPRAAHTQDLLLSSGVMILDLPADESRAARDRHEITLRPGGAVFLTPRLVRIAPNALPVFQRASFTRDDFRGTGRAGQSIVIEPATLFDEDEAGSGWVWRLTGPGALTVRVSDYGELKKWKLLALVAGRVNRRDYFFGSGPKHPVFIASEREDGSRIEIRFGNKVNGRCPTLDATIEVKLLLSAGRGGDVRNRIEWMAQGHRTRWENRQPISGGKDAQTIEDTFASLRRQFAEGRTFATSSDIVRAARALPGVFGVERAIVEEGWERGLRRPRVATTRTLLVTRRGGAETAEWQAEIARRLRPRLPVGERLLVTAPLYRRFRIRARATSIAGEKPETIAAVIERDLLDRLTPSGKRGAEWPLRRPVTDSAVGGWIRRIEGVAHVSEVTLLDESGQVLEHNRLDLRAGELPLLVVADKDIVVTRGGER